MKQVISPLGKCRYAPGISSRAKLCRCVKLLPILAMLSSASLMVDRQLFQEANTGAATAPQPLTYELVRGSKRISLGSYRPRPRSHGWTMIVICSGSPKAGK